MGDLVEDAARPLSGQAVILTGASAGLGRQFAYALDRAGAAVVLAARRAEPLFALASELGRAHAVPCDVTDAAQRDHLFAEAVDRFGRIDALVNNAGAINNVDSIDEPLESINKILQINLVAPYALSQLAARHMREHGGGAIVNLSSLAAFSQYPWVPQSSYIAAKSGLNGLTRELAAQWAHYKIRVNSIAPGVFRTEITEPAFADPSPDSLVRKFLERTPMQRPGAPGELDNTLIYLLDPRSSFVTGQVITVDGGLTLG